MILLVEADPDAGTIRYLSAPTEDTLPPRNESATVVISLESRHPVVVFVGGAVAGAIIGYGVEKLLDEVFEPDRPPTGSGGASAPPGAEVAAGDFVECNKTCQAIMIEAIDMGGSCECLCSGSGLSTNCGHKSVLQNPPLMRD